MTHPTAPDPQWAAIQATSDEEDAFNELQARLDRANEHAPSTCPASSGAGQRPVLPSRATPHPTPPAALASRSAATGAGTNNEAASGASDALAA